MFLLVPAHPGSPRQRHKMAAVIVVLFSALPKVYMGAIL